MHLNIRMLPCMNFSYLRGTISSLRSTISSWRGLLSSHAEINKEYLGDFSSTNPPFYSKKTDITKFSYSDEGFIFRMEKNKFLQVLPKGVHKLLYTQFDVFNECGFMIRKPALEVCEHLSNANYSVLSSRYIFYGSPGVGKTTSLAHVILHCHALGWIIVHVPFAHKWFVHFKEVAPSQHREQCVNLPMESVEWLTNFRQVNGEVLKNKQLTTHMTYEFSKRDKLEKDSPLEDVLNHGIERPLHADYCVDILLKELRFAACEDKCRVLVAISSFNCFFGRTKIKTKDGSLLPIEQVSLVNSFKEMISSEWTGGATVLTVDERASQHKYRGNCLPRFLLRQEGFALVDPFVPVEVQNYSDLEVDMCMRYYFKKRWLQNDALQHRKGKAEFLFLTGKNPYEMFKMGGERW